MGTYIYFRSFSGRRYLSELRIVSLLSTVIALHMCSILFSIAISLLLLGNNILRLGVSRSARTFLSLLAMERPFELSLMPLAANATLEEGSNF